MPDSFTDKQTPTNTVRIEDKQGVRTFGWSLHDSEDEGVRGISRGFG